MKQPRKALAAALMLSAAVSSSAKDFTKYVNPFVGTDLHGHTFPAATAPFGMVQAGPDTRINGWDGCSGYHYSDSVILGFTHTHLSGVGCLDYGDILFMPVTGSQVTSTFSHDKETATPGYYQVYLDQPKVNVRLAAGRRMAMHEYEYTAGTRREVYVDLHHRDRLLGCTLELVGDHAIKGWRQSRSWAKPQDVYFYAEFDSPIAGAEFADSATVRLRFADSQDKLRIKIGLSSVSCGNAKANLLAEKQDWDFEALRKATKESWNDWLSRIDMKSDEETMRTFYSALYHCAIHPSLYSDANGEYRGLDRQVHKAEGFERYSVFSVWDVFRSTFPLYNMIARDYMPDFLKSMLSVYDEGGALPKWEISGYESGTMIGFNAVSVIADAYFKGTLPKEDLAAYYEAMKATAENSDPGHKLFCQYGFDPAGEDNESVSKTLEFAYDDWCIAMIAKELGKADDYAQYIRQAQYWKNVFDSGSGFMRPRELGGWAPEFDPTKVSSHFTEANSWQYSFFVPQDIAGHIDSFGGRDAYIAKLDSLFTASNDGIHEQLIDVDGLLGLYAHGNEPSHHVAYLYDFVGQPWKTQELTRRICKEFYSSAPDGLCGNEDCGQMSAWYVLSATGLYSLTPGSTTMALTTPIADKAVFKLGDGKKFSVKTDKPGLTYIRTARLNGKPLYDAAIDFSSITGGGSLCLKTGSAASDFGIDPVRVPTIDSADRYDANFPAGFGQVKEETGEFTMKASLQTEYVPSYSAGGPEGLIDGLHGKLNWRAGRWQGYKHEDVDVILDLLGTKEVDAVSAEFLQDMENYIWMPSEMLVYTSTDGENWVLAGTRRSDVAIDDAEVQIADWKIGFEPRMASHVRVVAHIFGEIPSWHRGYGDVGFTFIDEITVSSR